MQLTRLEVLALLPDCPEVGGYSIEISPSGRVSLQAWMLDTETLVEGLPEMFSARLVWHKQQLELGPLILIKINLPPQPPVNFYLQPDPAKLKQRYRLAPYSPPPEP
jgi:hypothetical protein